MIYVDRSLLRDTELPKTEANNLCATLQFKIEEDEQLSLVMKCSEGMLSGLIGSNTLLGRRR